jgi:hypothetical protein
MSVDGAAKDRGRGWASGEANAIVIMHPFTFSLSRCHQTPAASAVDFGTNSTVEFFKRF